MGRPWFAGFRCDLDQARHGLARLHGNICPYRNKAHWGEPGTPCDCKYILPGRPIYPHGEKTGCCEVRVVRELLLKMTKEEWDEIMEREGK